MVPGQKLVRAGSYVRHVEERVRSELRRGSSQSLEPVPVAEDRVKCLEVHAPHAMVKVGPREREPYRSKYPLVWMRGPDSVLEERVRLV